MQVTIRMTNESRQFLEQFFKEYELKLSDFSPWFRETLMPDFFAAQYKIWETLGSYGGTPWAPNQGEYAKKKEELGLPVGIWSGNLLASMTQENDTTEVSPTRFYHSTNVTREGTGAIGAAAEYAHLFQEGQDGIPGRPFMPDEAWWEEEYSWNWEQSLIEFITGYGE